MGSCQLNTTISALGEQAHTAFHASPDILSAIDEYMDREINQISLYMVYLPQLDWNISLVTCAVFRNLFTQNSTSAWRKLNASIWGDEATNRNPC